jgi:hypothetical protein
MQPLTLRQSFTTADAVCCRLLGPVTTCCCLAQWCNLPCATVAAVTATGTQLHTIKKHIWTSGETCVCTNACCMAVAAQEGTTCCQWGRCGTSRQPARGASTLMVRSPCDLHCSLPQRRPAVVMHTSSPAGLTCCAVADPPRQACCPPAGNNSHLLPLHCHFGRNRMYNDPMLH